MTGDWRSTSTLDRKALGVRGVFAQVPLNKLPPPSVARRRLREECASTPLAWQQESAQKDEERQPLSVEHAAVEPVSLTQLEEALAEVAEGDEEALLRLDAQVLLERRNGEGTLADESSPARASRSDERLESSPLLGECVLVCRLALLLSYCFGLDVQRAFPGLRVRTSLNAKSGEGSPPTDGSQLGARPANEKCRGGGLSLLSNLLERSPYAAPSAPQPLSSCEVSLVPSWHCAQVRTRKASLPTALRSRRSRRCAVASGGVVVMGVCVGLPGQSPRDSRRAAGGPSVSGVRPLDSASRAFDGGTDG